MTQPKPSLSLTGWLTALVVGALAPLLILTALMLRGLLDTSRALGDRGQVDTVRALALAVDAEVRSWKATALALAASRSARPDRWQEFYEEARLVGLQHDGWVVLTEASGAQLFNTLRPYGAPLQRTGSPETIDAIFREGKPIVSDLIWGPNAQRHLVAVAVPVVRDGRVVNCLTLNFSPDRLRHLLLRQHLSPAWVASVLDRGGRIVARNTTETEDASVGSTGFGWFTLASRTAERGLATGPMIDGRLGQIAFEQLTEAPWVMALAIPVMDLQSGVPWAYIAAGSGLALLAVGVGVYVGRKLTVPLRGLAQASEGYLRGDTNHFAMPIPVREVSELEQALAKASAAARAHAQERERDSQALEQANRDLERRVDERTAALTAANEALRTAIADLQDEIAQRRRAEEEVKAVARFPSENPNPVLRLDAGGRILYANRAGAPILEHWSTSVGGRAPDPWPATVREVLNSGAGTTVEIVRGERTYAVVVAPIPEAGYVNLYTADVSELRRLNAELEQRVDERTAALGDAVRTLERQAAQLRTLTSELTLAEQRERRRLAELLHDEVQQLLVAMRLRAQMVSRTDDTQVREGAREIIALVDETLAKSRSLIAELSPPALHKGDLLSVLEWLSGWMREKQHLKVSLTPPPTPVPRVTEETAVILYQAVRECLLNIVKHAQVDAAEVTVGQDHQGIMITVTDAGVGFDPARLRVEGGTDGGVGLIGIRQRLEGIGGYLGISGAPGSGSRFTLVAPLGATSEMPPASSSGFSVATQSESRRLRVLVVDDRASVRRGVIAMLQGASDLEVAGEAEDGRQAIEMTRHLAPDVILMDIGMPVMNGIDATRAIRVAFPAVRVIGHSMIEDPVEFAAMLEAGAEGYLSKNESAAALLSVIRGRGTV